jgi:hypothetical protein
VRKIAAVAVAIPFLAFIVLSSLIRRNSSGRGLSSAPKQLLGVAMAVVLLVGGMLLGLPAKEVAGVAPPSFAPLAPQAVPQKAGSTLPLDVGFQVQFTKPMNEASVESAVSISPDVNLKFQWDATAQVVSMAPDPFWQPHTSYTVQISGAATDQEGLGLSAPMTASFESGAPTSGVLIATQVVGDQVSPGTAFQITFTRPVKLSTVVTRLSISPSTPVAIVGDDPTDLTSQVFTITPKTQLASDADFVIVMADGGTDAAGAALQSVTALRVHTMLAPAVIKFRPVDGGVTYDTRQPVSVRFTVPMDEKSTAAAFSVTVNGSPISGSKYWAEGDTVLVMTLRSPFKIGDKVVAKVTTAAHAAGASGLHLGATTTATFTVARPKAVVIAYTGGIASSTSPYHSSEVYYMALMNCTRTGGWVTVGGNCSTETHHTLPAQGLLRLSADISNKVSRPYAKYMADRRILDHYAYHDPHWRLCNWGGYCGASWGENIASPSNASKFGMIDVELFYQNEYWCRCEHYYNIMAPFLNQAGVGVWVANGVVRVSIDFYG